MNVIENKYMFSHSMRCGIRPFDEARSVLEGLSEETKVKSEKPDILYLCHSLSLEVVNLTQCMY